MRRDSKWKIVLYLDDAYGELYDLGVDPGEKNNLWNNEALRSTRDELKIECLSWLARGSLTANRKSSRAPQKAMKI
jgi:hypothetical protein